MHTNVDVRAAFLGQGLENRKKIVGNNMNKVTEIYQESCFKFARKNLYETTCFLYGYILLALREKNRYETTYFLYETSLVKCSQFIGNFF